jgi:hypothetical protein
LRPAAGWRYRDWRKCLPEIQDCLIEIFFCIVHYRRQEIILAPQAAGAGIFSLFTDYVADYVADCEPCELSRFVGIDGADHMAQKISDDDALLLAQILRSFGLDETTSAARFVESLTFDAIFREEWERICGSQHQFDFYDRLADDIFDALENHGDLENSVRERAGQLLREIEARYASLLGEIQAQYAWICKHVVSMGSRRDGSKTEFLPF